MQICNETKNTREEIESVVSEIGCLAEKYPKTELWWFGSSVKCNQQKVGDIDLVIISSSKKELNNFRQKLRQDYPNSHFDHASIYIKSNNDFEQHKLPLHFVFGERHEVLANHRLAHGIQMGIQVK